MEQWNPQMWTLLVPRRSVLIREVSWFQGWNNTYFYCIGTKQSVLIMQDVLISGSPHLRVPLYLCWTHAHTQLWYLRAVVNYPCWAHACTWYFSAAWWGRYQYSGTPSNPGTLGISQSVLIRGVASFQGWNCNILFGLFKVAWIQGWPHFRVQIRGSSL